VLNEGQFAKFVKKIVAMATSRKESQKDVRIDKIHANSCHLVKKILKIGRVDADIFCWFKK